MILLQEIIQVEKTILVAFKITFIRFFKREISVYR